MKTGVESDCLPESCLNPRTNTRFADVTDKMFIFPYPMPSRVNSHVGLYVEQAYHPLIDNDSKKELNQLPLEQI
jgi:hypothetical protein